LHDLAAQPTTVEIEGQTFYGSGIEALTHKVYKVRGTVSFTPMPDHTYIVRGVLGSDYSSVWIEDLETRTLMGKKVEIGSRAKPGVVEK
jgi:hypothetical protein